jgi:peptidyl-prolyl cis-trans isomerase C
MRTPLFKDWQRIALFSVLLSFLSAGCDKIDFFGPKKDIKEKAQTATVMKGTLIARVNNMPITLEDLNTYIETYNLSVDLRQDLSPEDKKRIKKTSREDKINFLKDVLIRQAVFYQTALDQGLDRRDDLVEVLRRNKIEVLSRAMQSETVKNIEVSSAEIEAVYKSREDLFREPEVRKIREIVTKTEPEARQILIELLQAGDFISLAKTRSIADSARNGGDLGVLKKGQRGEQFGNFDEVAFSPALQQGAISSVFKGPEGYYIIKIEEIKGGRKIPLSEAWDRLKALLLIGKQQDELDKAYGRLSREAKIEIYEGEIK